MKRLLLIIMLGVCGQLFPQINEDVSNFKTDTIDTGKSLRVIAIPVVFTTPETGFGFGGGAQIFLLNKSNIYNSRLSNVLISGIYTTNKQIMFEVNPQIYFNKGNYFLKASYKLKVFPNSFWGIGNTTPDENEEFYNMTSHIFKASFLKRLPPFLNFGFQFIFENHEITELQEGSLLDQGDIPGSTGAIIVGLGATFNYDTRKNVADPQSGHFINLSGQFSSKNFGSTYNFNKYIADIRKYIPLGKNSILATQLYLESNYGDVPFQAKAWFGGGYRARGYYAGRFMDDYMYVIQAEYRLRFHARWGLALFGLIGEVADRPENFFQDIKPSIGGGIRYKITKDQNTLLRFGIGFGKNRNSGIYFGVNQAF